MYLSSRPDFQGMKFPSELILESGAVMHSMFRMVLPLWFSGGCRVLAEGRSEALTEGAALLGSSQKRWIHGRFWKTSSSALGTTQDLGNCY